MGVFRGLNLDMPEGQFLKQVKRHAVSHVAKAAKKVAKFFNQKQQTLAPQNVGTKEGVDKTPQVGGSITNQEIA